MKKIVLLLTAIAMSATIMSLTACNRTEKWSSGEKKIINGGDSVMRVLTVNNPADSTLLRTKSKGFSAEMIQSPEYRTLAARMVATVTSPEQDGVGIAGPQVGILRRIVAVQRFDKEGEPFEVYPNIRIMEFRGEKESGPEGCLSVPGMHGEVMRYHDITIAYTDPETLDEILENVRGFTAVIFQHETDHLDGILYTDCAISTEAR